jgi:hypothetical protein
MTPRSLQSLSHRSYILDANGTSVECFPLSADEAGRMATLTSVIRFYVPGCRTIAFDPLAGKIMQDLTELNNLHRHDIDDAEYREDVLLNDLGRHVDQLALERREHLLGASLVLGESEADHLHLSVFLVVPHRIKSCDLQFSL